MLYPVMIYMEEHRLFADIISKFGIEFTFMKLDDKELLRDAIKPNTKDDMDRNTIQPPFKYYRHGNGLPGCQ